MTAPYTAQRVRVTYFNGCHYVFDLDVVTREARYDWENEEHLRIFSSRDREATQQFVDATGASTVEFGPGVQR